MKIDIDIKHLYTITKKEFQKCMSNKENKFLPTEMEDPEKPKAPETSKTPINKMILKNDYVKIKKLHNNSDHMVIEAGIMLLSQENKKIGKYSLVVDNNYQSIDDYLVFD